MKVATTNPRDFALSAGKIALGFAILGGLVYGVNLNGPFVFDDLMWVEDARSISQILPSTSLLKAPPDSPIYGRPVAAWTLAVNYALGGLHPLGYHVVNVALHVLAATVLVLLLRMTLRKPALPRPVRYNAELLALTCAAVWFVHPLQTECVHYLSQRTESLTSLFVLLTLYASMRSYSGGARWRLLAVASCWLGVATKETAAVGPLLVVLYDLAFNGTSTDAEPARDGQARDGRARDGRYALYAGLFSSWLLLAALVVQFPRSNSVEFSLGGESLRYLQNQALAIAQYLRLVVWPHPLVLDYGTPRDLTFAAYRLPGLLIVAGLIATVALWRSHRAVAFLGSLFFLVLAPTSSLLPILTEVAAERRMYLPSAAVLILMLVGVYWLAIKIFRVRRLRELNRVYAIVCGCVLLLFAAKSVHRGVQYRSTIELWKSSVLAVPDNPRAAYNLAVEYGRAGRVAEAIDAYRHVLTLRPKHARSHNNLAVAYQHDHNYRLALRHFAEATAARRGWELPVANLAWLLATCDDEEIRNGEEALRLARWLCRKPSQSSAKYLDTLAAAQAEVGAFAKAMQTARIARQTARISGDEPLQREISERLRLYEQGRPYRTTPIEVRPAARRR